MAECPHRPDGGRCAPCGAAEMDAARAATGDLTCRLTVIGWETRGLNEVPGQWAGVWVPRL